jgi:hypothetical protein
LSDDSAIVKRKKQLDELQERREQLGLMIEWQKGLAALEEETVSMLSQVWQELTPGFMLNDKGKVQIKNLMRKYSVQEIIDAMRYCAERNLVMEAKGLLTHESVNKAFGYIGRTCAFNRQVVEKPYIQNLYYIRGILRNRFRLGQSGEWESLRLLKNAYENEHRTLDDLNEMALSAQGWDQWRKAIEGTRHEEVLHDPSQC